MNLLPLKKRKLPEEITIKKSWKPRFRQVGLPLTETPELHVTEKEIYEPIVLEKLSIQHTGEPFSLKPVESSSLVLPKVGVFSTLPQIKETHSFKPIKPRIEDISKSTRSELDFLMSPVSNDSPTILTLKFTFAVIGKNSVSELEFAKKFVTLHNQKVTSQYSEELKKTIFTYKLRSEYGFRHMCCSACGRKDEIDYTYYKGGVIKHSCTCGVRLRITCSKCSPGPNPPMDQKKYMTVLQYKHHLKEHASVTGVKPTKEKIPGEQIQKFATKIISRKFFIALDNKTPPLNMTVHTKTLERSNMSHKHMICPSCVDSKIQYTRYGKSVIYYKCECGKKFHMSCHMCFPENIPPLNKIYFYTSSAREKHLREHTETYKKLTHSSQ